MDGARSRTEEDRPVDLLQGCEAGSGFGRGSNYGGLPTGKRVVLVHSLERRYGRVGIVAEHQYLFNGSTKDHAEIFQREVQNNEWIKEHLAEGEQTGEYRVTGDYSYRNRYCAIDGLALAGDALGFFGPRLFFGSLFGIEEWRHARR